MSNYLTRLALAITIMVPSAEGWTQQVSEPSSSSNNSSMTFDERLAALRKVEVELDAEQKPATGFAELLRKLELERAWAQTCVQRTETTLSETREEIALLGEAITGEDVRVTLERTRVGNQVKVLETQLGGCRLLIVRAKKLQNTILTTQSGEARKTLLTREAPIWDLAENPNRRPTWSSWVDAIAENDNVFESIFLTLVLALGGFIFALGGKTGLKRHIDSLKREGQTLQVPRDRIYYLEALRHSLPSLVLGTILWLGGRDLENELSAPLLELAKLCLAFGLTHILEKLWRFRDTELQAPSPVSWKALITVTAAVMFFLTTLDLYAYAESFQLVARATLLGLLAITVVRIQRQWQPSESWMRSILHLSTAAAFICLGAELAGFRNLSTTIFARFSIAVVGLTLTFTAIRALSGSLTRWSARTQPSSHEVEDVAEKPFLDTSRTWVEFTIGLSLWTMFGIFIVGLIGYADQGSHALKRLTVDGFAIGDFQFVPGRIIFALLVLYALLTFSRWFRGVFETRWIQNSTMDRGTRDALTTFLGYLGTSASVITSLVIAGVDFTGLAIIFSALSVGIGFGLQNVVNNFVSGLILLFERPIRSGDWVSVGSTEGHVKKIRIRSTLIQTLDRADVIVPNSELISAQVTNWMLRDRIGRVKVPVGVAYGSDTRLVAELLLKIANEHSDVLNEPYEHRPTVTFHDFGASSLDFSLRVFIADIEKRFVVASDLRFAIDEAFRSHGIEIPFPQRDLHLRSSQLEAHLMEAEPSDSEGTPSPSQERADS